jgi:hypothetical protein
MTYVTGTLSNAAPASTFLSIIDATITAETGLTKVSSAIVVGTNTWNVYKSAAANNSFGQDFHFAIGYPTATPTTLLMAVFEGWNTGTLLATNYPPNATVTPNGSFANPGAALALPSTGAIMGYLQSIVLTTSCSYYYSVTPDRVIFSILTSAPTNIGFYIGLYDSFNTTAIDPFPLCVINLGIANITLANALPNASAGFTTRELGTPASNANNFCVFAAGGITCAWTRVESTADYYKGFNYLSRVLVTGKTVSYRGLLKDVYLGPPQTQNGDTVTWTIAGSPKTAVRAHVYTLGIYFLTI